MGMTTHTSAEQPELLPCPFCGGGATVTGPWEIGTSDIFEACIECECCGFHLSASSSVKSTARSQAAAKWSRRAPQAAQAQRAPLTDEQIDAAWEAATGGSFVTDDMRAFARRIYDITQEKQG